MAFLSRGTTITTGGDTIYTCPASKEAVIHALFISNVDGSTSATVTIEVYDSSATTTYKIGLNLPVPAQSTLVLDKPINLETGDYVTLTAVVNGDLEAVASILEQSV